MFVSGSELSPRSSNGSEACSWALGGRGSSTPSPPLSTTGGGGGGGGGSGGSWQQDEGVVLDADFTMDDLETEAPRKKKVSLHVPT